MEGFVEQPAERRRLICEQAQDQLNLPAASLEKDYWACWMLRELFSIPQWGQNFTFKGGTSLSKCWGLINRFSEDIDITIDRGFLGFGGEHSPENAPSKSQRRNATIAPPMVPPRTRLGDFDRAGRRREVEKIESAPKVGC